MGNFAPEFLILLITWKLEQKNGLVESSRSSLIPRVVALNLTATALLLLIFTN